MKILFISILLVIFTLNVNGQKRIQIKNQGFELQGVNNSEPIKKETKNFNVSINYVTGDFYAGVNLKNIRLFSDSLIPEDERNANNDLVTITGSIPINEIIYSQQVNQNYKIELIVKNRDKEVTAIFDFIVNYVKNSYANFHIIYASATLNLNDFNIKELFDFEPEIKLNMNFQAYIIGN
ncbi:MAG: hypothetical protein K8R58_14700 [Bacteroidales bacterium]|nr:hypothetical protein [Bacteroidales bacterium]